MNTCRIPNIFSMFDMTIFEIGFSSGVKVRTFVSEMVPIWTGIILFLIGNFLLTNGLKCVLPGLVLTGTEETF